MTKHRFERVHHGEVTFDLCFPCQGIWFDEFESVQLTPGGIIELFKLINARGTTVMVATHDPSVMAQVNRRVVTLVQGSLMPAPRVAL